MIPELLSFPHPIGFDTIYYAWRIKEGIVLTHWSGVFSSWLFYGILIPLSGWITVDPFLLLKLTMPLLFGLNTGGIYYLATNGFGWSVRKGLFAAGLFSFQVAILAVSWHFYRNMLGLGILLFTLPWILKGKISWRDLALFSLLSVFVVFSHEYASLLLFVAVFFVIVTRSLERKVREAFRILIAVSPAAIIFLANIFLMLNPVYSVVQPNILWAFQREGHYSGPLFFVTNYLSVVDPVQNYATYIDLMSSVFSLSILLYVAIIPLVIVGFFRHKVLDSWLAFLCVGAFGCLALPFFALDLWNRYMLMLVFPLTYYAANGFVKILNSAKPVVMPLWLRKLKFSKKMAKGFVLLSMMSGFVFMISPMFLGRGGVFGFPTTVNYVPSTMLCNTVPLEDVDGTVKAFQYVNVVMDGDSCLLAHDAFFEWARFSLDTQHIIVFFKYDVSSAIALATEQGYQRLWLVWWNTDIGWYGFKIPEGFRQVFSSGRISVFEYGG